MDTREAVANVIADDRACVNGFETVGQVTERVCAIFAEEREAAEYRHWCENGHERIGLRDKDGPDDGCPLCEAKAREAALVAAAQAAIDLGWTHDDECHPSDGRHSVRCIEARRVMALLRAALYLAPVSGEGKV